MEGGVGGVEGRGVGEEEGMEGGGWGGEGWGVERGGDGGWLGRVERDGVGGCRSGGGSGGGEVG